MSEKSKMAEDSREAAESRTRSARRSIWMGVVVAAAAVGLFVFGYLPASKEAAATETFVQNLREEVRNLGDERDILKLRNDALEAKDPTETRQALQHHQLVLKGQKMVIEAPERPVRAK